MSGIKRTPRQTVEWRTSKSAPSWTGHRIPNWKLYSRVIGASIVAVEDEQPAANAEREWSDAELTQLGKLLVRGLSIEEIARVLRRDRREVRDKVAEVGRACR